MIVPGITPVTAPGPTSLLECLDDGAAVDNHALAQVAAVQVAVAGLGPNHAITNHGILNRVDINGGPEGMGGEAIGIENAAAVKAMAVVIGHGPPIVPVIADHGLHALNWEIEDEELGEDGEDSLGMGGSGDELALHRFALEVPVDDFEQAKLSDAWRGNVGVPGHAHHRVSHRAWDGMNRRLHLSHPHLIEAPGDRPLIPAILTHLATESGIKKPLVDVPERHAPTHRTRLRSVCWMKLGIFDLQT